MTTQQNIRSARYSYLHCLMVFIAVAFPHLRGFGIVMSRGHLRGSRNKAAQTIHGMMRLRNSAQWLTPLRVAL